MKIMLIICLFLFGCINNPEMVCDKEPDAIIDNVCIYKNQFQEINNHDLRISLNIIHSVWSEKFDVDIGDIVSKHKDLVFNTQVEFIDNYSYKGSTTVGYVELLYRDSDMHCVANTALGHEMLHVLAGLYFVAGSDDHSNQELFMRSQNTQEQNKNSLENKINIEMCFELCESDCVWFRIK